MSSRCGSGSCHSPSSSSVGTAQRELESQCFGFLARGLAVSSRRTYASGLKKFWSFCALFPDLFPSSPIPASEYQLMMFVSWLARSLSPASVAVYLAAVRSYHIDWGFSDPTENKPRLRRVLQGIRRSRPGSSIPRCPITREILCSIHHILSVTDNGFDSVMFWSACSLAFFVFLRVSEFTSSPPFDPVRHLSPADVQFLPGQPSPGLRVNIKTSKTDPLGVGHLLYIGVAGNSLCPMSAMRTYLTLRGSSAGPLFVWVDRSPLTAAHVNCYLREILSRAGVSGQFSSHSFRIGAATSAAAAGIPDHLIQTLEYWTSISEPHRTCF